MTSPHYNARAESYETSADEAPVKWQERAHCRLSDPEMFFAPERERATVKKARVAAAKALCEDCVVAVECHAAKQPYGIWAGESEAPRVRCAPEPVQLTCGDAVGSEAGYKRHRRKGEPACPACRVASNAARLRGKTRAKARRVAATNYTRRVRVLEPGSAA